MDRNLEIAIADLSQKFASMRSLPPIAHLPEPQHDSDQHLLKSIIRNNGTSPVEFLNKHEQNLVARILLWYILDNSRQLARATQITEINLSSLTELFGYFANFTPQHFKSLNDTHPTSILEDVLYEVINDLKQTLEFPLSLPPAAQPHRNRWLYLLHQLFLLSENVPPLEWIKTEQHTSAIYITLTHLWNEVKPPESIWLSDDITAHKINQTVQRNSLHVTLENVVRKPDGFIINLAFPLSSQIYSDLKRTGLYIHIYENWQSVSRVRDNHNQEYLVCKAPQKRRKHWLFWQKYHISLCCYPALPTSPNIVTIENKDVSFKLIGIQKSNHQKETVYEENIDNLRWTVDL